MKLAEPRSPRPNRREKFIIEAVARDLAPEVRRWSVSGNGDGNLDGITRDLTNVLDRNFSMDGYDLAKALDHEGWECDSELVEILEGAAGARSRRYAAACTEWAQIQGLKPPEIGQRVRVIDPAQSKRLQAEGLVGLIRRNNPDATSTVGFPNLGHIDPTDGVRQGTIGYVIGWEELETAE